jgi:integrase
MLITELNSIKNNSIKAIRNWSYSRAVNLFCKHIEEKYKDYMYREYENKDDITLSRIFENNINLIKGFATTTLSEKFPKYIQFNIGLSSLIVFYKYLNKKNLISKGYLKAIISVINLHRRETPVLTKKDKYLTHTMLCSITDRANFWANHHDALKFKTIIHFIYFTGVRRNEIERIKRVDFDLERCSVKIGNRECFYNKEVRDMITFYFNKEPEVKNAFNITNSIIGRYNRILSRYKYKDKAITFESLRDANAHMIMRKTKNIGVLAKLHGETDELYLKKYALKNKYVESIYQRYIK